jgi:hypothetical protein
MICLIMIQIHFPGEPNNQMLKQNNHFLEQPSKMLNNTYFYQIMDMKRLNNITSDNGIYSRECLLIPGTKTRLLCGATCYIELDKLVKHEWGSQQSI